MPYHDWLKWVSRTITQLINYNSKIFSSLFPLIFLSKHISLYALGRPKWVLDIIRPLNQHFKLKTQSNRLKQVLIYIKWENFESVISESLCTERRNLLWTFQKSFWIIFCLIWANYVDSSIKVHVIAAKCSGVFPFKYR